jgi:uncharacterized membrane protein
MTRRHPHVDGAAERDPGRVVALSDGVIAIAVTLLVLGLRAPTDTRHLAHSLAAMWPAYLSYVITFMLVAQVWANHHVLFDHIRHADRLLLFLNAVLLMDIALIPFAASILANAIRAGQGERTAVLLHGLTFEVAAGLFNLIWWYARRRRRLLADTIGDADVRAITRRFQLALAWIGAATVLGALLPLAGVCLFTSFLAYYWLPVSGELGMARPRARPTGPVANNADGAVQREAANPDEAAPLS